MLTMSGGVTTRSRDSRFRRVIGRYSGRQPGPLLVCMGGMHGNEPAGVQALERVLKALRKEKPGFCGDFVGLAGNLAALEIEARFLDHDLNRAWANHPQADFESEQVAVQLGREALEKEELLGLMTRIFQERKGEAHFMDMHTSSAEGVPFAVMGDTLRNRRFAKIFPVPTILGLEEQVEGSMLEFLNNQGWVTLGFEGGQHDAPTSVDHHEAAIWLALAAAGNLPEEHPRVRDSYRRLRLACLGLPRLLEVRYRHGILPGDGFRMEPGFVNFQRVHKTQVLAKDNDGEIQAYYHARMLLPLYQGAGDDGFFLGKEVNPFWLRLSAFLRWMRLSGLAPYLPGVKAHPWKPDTYMINRRIARWLVVEIFHLLGFRKRRPEFGKMVVSRRRYDMRSPDLPKPAEA
ncbi:MAG: hypothetical protein DWQ01_11125 [Planctomycetota bacterium]|nr:MAG: hypothetical protein DWQ01_11125 [Planctomycetota bacterium]